MENWLTKLCHLDAVQIGNVLKQKLSKLKCVNKLFARFDLPVETLRYLNFEIDPLADKSIYAETDIDKCRIRKSLFARGLDYFIENYMFIICHEIVHFCWRNAEQRDAQKKPMAREKTDYFEDEEEVIGFCMSIAYEIEKGSPMEIIVKRVYPKIEFHFKDKKLADEFFGKLLEKSKEFLS